MPFFYAFYLVGLNVILKFYIVITENIVLTYDADKFKIKICTFKRLKYIHNLNIFLSVREIKIYRFFLMIRKIKLIEINEIYKHNVIYKKYSVYNVLRISEMK